MRMDIDVRFVPERRAMKETGPVKLPYDKLIRMMIDASGKTAKEISEGFGRGGNYINALLSRGSVPNTSTLVDIANGCGFDVVVQGHGMEFSIPSESDLKALNESSMLFISTDSSPDGVGVITTAKWIPMPDKGKTDSSDSEPK